MTSQQKKHTKSRRGSVNPISAGTMVPLLMAVAALSANAQVFVTVPTTTTLWGGTADYVADGLASMTAPSSGVILTGTKISAITGKPIRHLWYGDTSNGLCRMDPEVDQNAAPVGGIGLHQNNILTCIGAIRAAAFTPGQIAFDGSTNTLYVPDTGRTTAGVIRIHYNPSGDGGNGALDPLSVQSLIGTTVNRNAAGGCPQLTDPKTGQKVPIVPDAAAIGPDGALYVGSIRDGAIIRIKNAGTFDPSSDSNCQNGIDIPILSADERVGAGHVFGLGWVGHTLLGNDNIAPWVLFNAGVGPGNIPTTGADQCLTPANGNNLCGAPVSGGAPMPTEVLGAFVPGPQAAGVTDAQYPAFPGNTWFVASFPTVTKITNISSTSSMTVQTSYGGTFPFVTGLTADPQDLNNKTLYVGSDATQGSINGAASMYQVVEQSPAPAPPLAPAGVTAAANSVPFAASGSATVSWFPQINGQPITSYVVRTFFAPSTPGLPPTPACPDPTDASSCLVPDLTVAPDSSGRLATTADATGLTFATFYQFAVEACNGSGCSPLSGFSNAVDPLAVTAPPAPVSVSATPQITSALVAWTQPGNGGSAVTSSKISSFDVTTSTAGPSVVVSGATQGGLVTGLSSTDSYTFTVTATNVVGTSSASTPSAAITPLPANSTDMQLKMTGPASAVVGSSGVIVGFTLTVTNAGPAPANQVTLTDTLPAPFFSVTSTQGFCTSTVGTNQLSCNLSAMAAGTSATIVVQVSVPATASGSITNTATASADIADPLPANNSASFTTQLTNSTTSVTADIQVTGSSSNGNPVHGTAVTYTWQIKNATGNVNVPGVVFKVANLAPSGASLAIQSVTGTNCSFTPGGSTATCSLGTINGGAAATVTVTAIPSAAAPANSYQSTGSATFTGTDSNPANNQFTVFIGAQ